MVDTPSTTGDELTAGQQPTRRCRRDAAVLSAWAVAALAAVPRLLTAAAGIQHTDEGTWMARSAEFSDAVSSADFGNASATVRIAIDVATMPGVTTMWIGTLARGLWGAGRDLGLWAVSPGDSFANTVSGLIVSEALMAVATSVLVGLLVFLVARWVGWRVAAVAGVLIATEPFLVAHGAVLHTDELVALFGIGALVATALVLGLPHRTAWTGERWAALAAGGLWGGALLTKVSALMFLPAAGLLGVWAAVAALRQRPEGRRVWPVIRPLCRLGAWWLVAAAAVTLVAYPALWVDPISELQAMRESAGIASRGHSQFFLGEATTTPGPAYYFVALPLRVTPWFLFAGVAGFVTMWWRPAMRRLAVAIACMGVPPLVTLSLASSQFARFGLPLLVLGAIVIGIAAVPVFDALRRRFSWRQTGRAAAVLAGALVFAHAVAVAPWGTGYFNPALGGAATAERAIVISLAERPEGTNDIIEANAVGQCDDVTVFAFIAMGTISCGDLAADHEVPTYIAIHVFERQRLTAEAYADVIGDRELVGEVKARGITYVEVFGPSDEGVHAGSLPHLLAIDTE